MSGGCRLCADEPTAFNKYSFLRDLQDTNETLFYALVLRNIQEILPLVYTPTVGEGCQRFSEIWKKPRGLFLSYPNRQRIEQILNHSRYDKVKCIVVSDGERILGLGDQGAGGMGIPIGKMALYTALGGIHPEYCLPILLDVGTDNEDRLKSPLYIGWRHQRVRGEEYDAFVDDFVNAVKKRWPHVLLQWEDFARKCEPAAGAVSRPTLHLQRRYSRHGRDCRRDLAFRDQRDRCAAGATKDCGDGLRNGRYRHYQPAVATDVGQGNCGGRRARPHLRNRPLRPGHGKWEGRAARAVTLRPQGRGSPRLAQPGREIALEDVVRNAKPTVLIGVSGQRGAFTEPAIREMAKYLDRPVIFPLSNPVSCSEATPQDLLNWTEGRALIGTGSPFGPVNFDGKNVAIDQTNNSYIFPGLALGIIASRAKRVTDTMIMAAAKELVQGCPTQKDKQASLLPSLSDSRQLSP